MSTHPLLRNADILYEICAVLGQPILEEQDTELYKGEGVAERDAHAAQRALLATVLTCRTFMPVALDALWRSLPHLDPLLNVLGYNADVQDVAASALNWTRFEWYARRVRSIYFRETDAALPRFILRRTPLLPNLRTLRWGHDRLHLVPRFFVPSLRHLELSAYFYPVNASRLQELCFCMASLVTSLTRGLQKLSLNGCDASVSAELTAFHHLTDLSLPYRGLSCAVWRNLAAIPNLERLEINYMDDGEEQETARTVALSSTTGLVSLAHLELGGFWDNMLCLLRDLPSTAIPRIELMYPWCPSVSTSGDLPAWRTVAQELSTKRPQSLRISHYSTEDIPICGIDAGTLEPLFAFTALEHLDIDYDLPGSFTITDDDIRRLASALPRLTDLLLAFPMADGTCLTVTSLVHLATTSPRLEFLVMDINLEKDGRDLLPDPEDVTHASSAVYEIRLRLRPAPPPDPSIRRQRVDTLAHILHRLFPELEYASTKGHVWPGRAPPGDWEEKELECALFMDPLEDRVLKTM